MIWPAAMCASYDATRLQGAMEVIRWLRRAGIRSAVDVHSFRMSWAEWHWNRGRA